MCMCVGVCVCMCVDVWVYVCRCMCVGVWVMFTDMHMSPLPMQPSKDHMVSDRIGYTKGNEGIL